MRQLWVLRQLWKKSHTMPREVSGMVQRSLAMHGLWRRVDVRLHENQSQALTWGVWRPRILLPMDVCSLSLTDAKMILEHELGHVRRFDSLATWMLQILCTLYWFHPLSWWLMRRSQLCKELACDDLLLLSGIDASRYAACLGAATLRVQSDALVPEWVSSFTRPHPALVRLHAILDERRQRSKLTLIDFWRVSAPLGMLSVFVASLGVKVAAEAQPQMTELLKERSDQPTVSLWTHVLVPMVRSNRVHEAITAIKAMSPSRMGSPSSQPTPGLDEMTSQASATESSISGAKVSSSSAAAISRVEMVTASAGDDASRATWEKDERSEATKRYSHEAPVRGVFASQRVTIPSNRGQAPLMVDSGRGAELSKVASRAKSATDVPAAKPAKSETNEIARVSVVPKKQDNISGVSPVANQPPSIPFSDEKARQSGGQDGLTRQSTPVLTSVDGANDHAPTSHPEVLSVMEPLENVSDEIIIPMTETVMGPRGPHRIAEVELPLVAGKTWKIETSANAMVWTDSPQVIAIEARPDEAESRVGYKAMVTQSIIEAPYEFLRIRSERSEMEQPTHEMRVRNSLRPARSEK